MASLSSCFLGHNDVLTLLSGSRCEHYSWLFNFVIPSVPLHVTQDMGIEALRHDLTKKLYDTKQHDRETAILHESQRLRITVVARSEVSSLVSLSPEPPSAVWTLGLSETGS